MLRLLFWALVGSAIVILYLSVMQPRRLRRLGRNFEKVGWAYVAAILIGAVLRQVFGWGT